MRKFEGDAILGMRHYAYEVINKISYRHHTIVNFLIMDNLKRSLNIVKL